MPNFWYLPGLEAFARGNVDWVEDDIKLFAIDKTAYDANENQSTLGEISPAAVVAEGEIADRDATNGSLSGTPPVWDELYGAPISAIVIAKVEEPIESSRLLLYLDEGTRLPLIPNGTQVTFFWHGGHIADL